MSETKPTIWWVRRDLRLADNPALMAAIAAGGPVIPVFIRDALVEGLGAAPKWRLGLGLEAFARALEGMGSRLVLRSGEALQVLRALVAETGAGSVHWGRLYDPDAIARDTRVKAGLKDDGVKVASHAGHVLFEPWTVESKTGSFYRVYSPMWRAVKDREVGAPLATPGAVPAPEAWPGTEALEDWALGTAMERGAQVCLPYQRVGEAVAQARMGWFVDEAIQTYKEARNYPARDATSGMSENLTHGEISPRQCWCAGQRALHEGAKGAETWLKELVWREFAYHLTYHTPHIASENWRREWDGFPWSEDGDTAEVLAWKRGQTGVPFVDAAMREMYVTGKMHNRARMIVGSYLTKHLMTHWKVGKAWFEDCLTDWDPASNAMGWQWVAGSGPDAAPYFRIFNPETQLDRFDPDHAYPARWIAEGQEAPHQDALAYFEAVPRSWGLSQDDTYPAAPVVGLREGRTRALTAYEERKG